MSGESMAKPEKVNENSFKRNFATDDDISARFMKYAMDIMVTTRQNRRTLESQWIDDVRAWSCLPDEFGYQGRANIYVPEMHTQIESSVEKCVSAMFSGNDLLQTIPLAGTNRKTADAIRN